MIELSRLKHEGGPKGSRKTPSIKQLALIEEERRVVHLKALLRSAADHLEYEVRRVDEGALWAHYAEVHEKEASAKLVAAEFSKSPAEGEYERSVAESKISESAERELQRLKSDVISY